MKKLLILIGLVVFLAPVVTSAETSFKSELPKCKNLKIETKYKVPCYGKIVYPGGNIYEGEFGFKEGRDGTIKYYYEGVGTKTFIGGKVQSGIWENNNFIDEQSDSFDFNQDIDFENEVRSPGWIRYQKKLK